MKIKKYRLSLFLSLAGIGIIPFLQSQTLPELKPELGVLVDKTPEGEIAFLKTKERCDELWNQVRDQQDYEQLSQEDQVIYENCTEDEDYWAILGPGCSWYCGGGQDTLSASSELSPIKGNNYSVDNIHDLNYKTAWVEGVPGHGIGERVTYYFPPQTPRITEIIIVNGYVKSVKAWKDNSRVRTLKMYLDDQPFAILHLEDTRQEQHFRMEPLGYGERTNYEELLLRPWWTITFEIMEVYPGDRYDDTAITEIYFNGIDVH